jgi:hypothetical protein
MQAMAARVPKPSGGCIHGHRLATGPRSARQRRQALPGRRAARPVRAARRHRGTGGCADGMAAPALFLERKTGYHGRRSTTSGGLVPARRAAVVVRRSGRGGDKAPSQRARAGVPSLRGMIRVRTGRAVPPGESMDQAVVRDLRTGRSECGSSSRGPRRSACVVPDGAAGDGPRQAGRRHAASNGSRTDGGGAVRRCGPRTRHRSRRARPTASGTSHGRPGRSRRLPRGPLGTQGA